MLVNTIFSFSLDVFKRLLFQGHEKSELCGKGLKGFYESNTIENIVGKGENAG